MHALDELVSRWRNNPDTESTLALCAHLGTSRRSQLMREVGNAAEAWHKDNAEVMLSVGRMYLEAGLLSEAQASLVQAGKTAPSEAEAYRYLGEVLLRRGDAVRGERALGRALRLGSEDDDTRLWHERALVFTALQKRVGAQAVADEVARTAPNVPRVPELPLASEPQVSRAQRRSRPPGSVRPSGPRRSSHPGSLRRRPSQPPVPPATGRPRGVPPPLPLPVRSAEAAREPAGEPLGTPPLRSESWKSPEPSVAASVDSPAMGYEELHPSPEAVLLSLSRVGLFEAESSVTPAWEAPGAPLPRRLWGLLVGTALVALLGLGGYQYARGVRADRAAEAQAIAVRVAGMLDGGSRADLRATETWFQRLFDLDSRGREAALLWLMNRSLTALASSGPVSGIEAALQRCRSVGVEESSLAFGRLASALAASDLAGAQRLIVRWDARTREDAYFQLFAGVVLERSGDDGALERLRRAIRLSPELVHAHALAARLALLGGGEPAAKSTLEPALGRVGSRPIGSVLRGLAWATSAAPEATPPELPNDEQLQTLMPALQRTTYALRGVVAQAAGSREEAREAFLAALSADVSPALATWVGFQAVEAGAPEVARRAANAVGQTSMPSANGRALTARIALLEGRLADAQKQTASLGPTARESRLIEAVTAYEGLQSKRLEQVLGSPTPDNEPELSGLRLGLHLLQGESTANRAELDALSNGPAVWGDLIAADIALNTGELAFVNALAQRRTWDPKRPAHARRLTRSYRYAADFEAALAAAATLLESPTAPDLAEALLALIDGGSLTAARGVLSQAGHRLGDLEPWLRGLLEARSGATHVAQPSLARLALPSTQATTDFKVIAVRALAAAGDRRAKTYWSGLRQRLPSHPDVATAGRELGLLPR